MKRASRVFGTGAIFVLALFLFVSGCGDGDDGVTDPTPTHGTIVIDQTPPMFWPVPAGPSQGLIVKRVRATRL